MDWIALFTDLLYYLQWLDVICFFGVIGMAIIGAFVSKKLAFESIIFAVILFLLYLGLYELSGLQVMPL